MNWRALTDPRGWYTSAGLAVLAAALRLPNLGRPNTFVFDETYYAKDAFSLLNFGYERAFVDGANDQIINGNLDVFTEAPAFVVHPPLGKWMIAAGEATFGMTPFGWRISAALVGIAMVVLVHRIALRLFANPWTAALAGLFMAIDGVAIVLSRTALLDQFLTFWLLVALYCLIRDREYYRRTLQLLAYEQPVAALRSVRTWRLAAIACMTAAFATKWSALWFAFGFGLLALLWDQLERRAHPDVDPQAWLKDLGWLGISIVLGFVGYATSWLGWFISTTAYDRTWSDNAISSWIHYHQTALNFHTGLTTEHPYQADAYGWPLMLRPTSFWYESYANGQAGCDVDKCAAEVLALGNPLLWWLSSAAVVIALALLLLRRTQHLNAQALAAPLAGIAAGWLPWIYFHERTTFAFYAIVFAPFMFMVLAQLLTTATMRTVVRDGEEFSVTIEEVQPQRLYAVIAVVVVMIGLSVFFYPIWAGSVIPFDAWQLRMWFTAWI